MHVSSVRAGSGVPFLVLAGVLWGTGGLLGQAFAAATGLSAFAIAAYRLAAGGLLLCLHLLLTGASLPRSRPARRRIAAVGVLAAIFQCGYFLAVTTTSVSLATLVTIGIAPVAVLAVERVARLRPVVGAALALAGLAMVVGPSGAAGPGLLAAVAAGRAFAALTVLSARPVPDLDANTTIGVGFVIGGALLAPVAIATGGLGFAPTLPAVGLLLALAVVPTAVAYPAYLRGLRTAPSGVAAMLALLEPVTAAVLAAVLLGDRLGIVGWTGAVVVCAAMLPCVSQSSG